MWESTNLSVTKEGREEICHVVPGTPRSNKQQRANSIEGTRLDEHDDNGLAQSTDFSYPQGSASVPGVQDEPDGDHEGEEDVERKGNRKVWNNRPAVAGQLCELVDKHGTHRCTNGVSPRCCCGFVDSEAHPKTQGT